MKNRPKRRLLNYLTFTKSERGGTILLIVMLLMVIVVPIVWRMLISPQVVGREVDSDRVDDFFDDLAYKERQFQSKRTSRFSLVDEEVVAEHPRVAQTFAFDPNTISVDSLMLLGLSAKQAAVINNYRSKGGKFRSPADFAKIYSIDAQTHSRLAGFIKIDSAQIAPPAYKSQSFEYETVTVDINTADTLALRKIRGIGPAYARRIIAYRTKLGGFYSKAQLLEVYGFSKELYDKILPSITLDTTSLKKINLNTVTFESLKAHPYLSNYEAKAIIYYRSKVKTIGHAHELLDNKLIKPEKYQKILPYFEVD